MDTAIQADWRRALLSGKFVQGTGRLCRVNADRTEEYCCLGVLCERALAAGIVERVFDAAASSYGYRATGSRDEPRHDLLPAVVVAWAQLEAQNPDVLLVDGDVYTLSTCNDGLHMSFAQIEELIGQL